MAAVAVMVLPIEALRYAVLAVAGTAFSTSARPKPRDQPGRPSITIATDRPGTWFAAM